MIKKNFKKKDQEKGIIAMIFFTFFGALMGVWIRMLSQNFSNFEQIFVRSFVVLFLAFLLYTFIFKKINIKSFQISSRDYFFIILRSILMVLAIWTVVVAFNLTKMANVSLLLAVPTTALLGIFFLQEKITGKKILFLIISFVGAMLILINNLDGKFIFGLGEIYALISSIVYSLGGLLRKKISKKVNNEMISLITLAFLTISSFFLISDFNFLFFLDKIFNNIFLIFIAGITLVLVSWLISYSYQKLDLIIANNLEFLEILFALLLGYFIYNEIPVFREIIGGILIILGVSLMIKFEK